MAEKEWRLGSHMAPPMRHMTFEKETVNVGTRHKQVLTIDTFCGDHGGRMFRDDQDPVAII
jgi:hypothetical protein